MTSKKIKWKQIKEPAKIRILLHADWAFNLSVN